MCNDDATPKKKMESVTCKGVIVFVRYCVIKIIRRNAFRVASFTRKKRHFQPIVKQLRVIKPKTLKQVLQPDK